MLKKTLLLTAMLCVYAILMNNSYVYTNSFRPPTARTGAPGESTCAGSSCHIGTANSGSGSVDITFSGEGDYAPGETYDMTVTVNDNGAIFGFQMIALDDSGNSVGNFDDTGTTNVGLRTVGGKQWVSHLNAPSTNSFAFKWTAPADDVGQITFYAAGNAANGDGGRNGDLIYTNSLAILLTSIETYEAERLSLKAFPNPADNQFSLEYQLPQNELMTIAAYDVSGRLVEALHEGAENAGKQQHQFLLEETTLTSGVYFITLQSESFVSSTKLFVQ